MEISHIQPEVPKGEKEIRWQEEKERVETVVDGLGQKVDEGIKEAVIALSISGINIAASCEGHLDHGTEAPYIDIETALAEELEEKIDQASSDEDAQEIIGQLEAANLQESEKVMELLEKFYQDRNVAYHRRIIVNPRARFRTRLESQGAALQAIKSGEAKLQRLQEFQAEMKAFTQFVKTQFFSENS